MRNRDRKMKAVRTPPIAAQYARYTFQSSPPTFFCSAPNVSPSSATQLPAVGPESSSSCSAPSVHRNRKKEEFKT